MQILCTKPMGVYGLVTMRNILSSVSCNFCTRTSHCFPEFVCQFFVMVQIYKLVFPLRNQFKITNSMLGCEVMVNTAHVYTGMLRFTTEFIHQTPSKVHSMLIFVFNIIKIYLLIMTYYTHILESSVLIISEFLLCNNLLYDKPFQQNLSKICLT